MLARRITNTEPRPLSRRLRSALALLALAALSGCATGDLVVLLPGEDGQVGAVEVSSEGQSLTLNTANAAARGATDAGTFSEADVQANFADALAATPPAPISYRLYFEFGSTTLTPASRPTLDAMLDEVRARAVADVQVTGHTDRVGSVERNDQLALERAQVMREQLIRVGLAPDMVRAVGRGEREPLVETPDEVAEPRNRRVQIFVR